MGAAISDSAISDSAGVLAPGAELARLSTGASWNEGPVWLEAEQVLRFSDIPGNRILELDPENGQTQVHRDEVEFANGRTLDLEGRVVQCSHGRRSVEREVGGVVTTLVDRWDGHRFNSPNDVIVASDGAIWFSDPDYGITNPIEGHPGQREYGGCYVFRFDETTGEVRPVVTDLLQPNGLAFSADESVLYVADSSGNSGGEGFHHIRAYDVGENWACTSGRVFAEIEPGGPDGLRVDVAGRLWTSSHDSVQVYTPEGHLVARIPVPEIVSNLCFGGPDGSTLFITASTSVYAIRTLTRAAIRPAAR